MAAIYPLLLLLLFAPFSVWLDLNLSEYFFKQGHFNVTPFYKFMFDYGTWPANITAIVAFVILILSYFKKKYKPIRSAALTLVLTLVIGSGLLINAGLKDHWGRPRPKQIEQYGGEQTYHPFWQADFDNPIPSKSFPCGHCANGFYFFALALVAKRLGNRRVELLGWALALGLGLTLSYIRMAMGGHFLSDVLVSMVLMWWVALAIDWTINASETA